MDGGTAGQRDRELERWGDGESFRSLCLSVSPYLRFPVLQLFGLIFSPPYGLSVPPRVRGAFSPDDGAFARRAQEVFDELRLSPRGALDYFCRARHVSHVVGLSPQHPRPSEQGVELGAQLVRGHRHKFIPCAGGVFRRLAQLLFPATTKANFDGD